MYIMDWRARQSLISTANFRQQCLAYPLEPCNVGLCTVSWSQKEVGVFKGCQGFSVICLTAHALWSRACLCSAWGGGWQLWQWDTWQCYAWQQNLNINPGPPYHTYRKCSVWHDSHCIHRMAHRWFFAQCVKFTAWRLNVQREMSLPISQTTALYKKWIMTCNNSL